MAWPVVRRQGKPGFLSPPVGPGGKKSKFTKASVGLLFLGDWQIVTSAVSLYLRS